MFEKDKSRASGSAQKITILLVFDGIMGLVVVSDHLVWVGAEHHLLLQCLQGQCLVTCRAQFCKAAFVLGHPGQHSKL